MTKAMRVPDYLGHILKAIERIDRYTADMDEVAFLSNELVIGEMLCVLLKSCEGIVKMSYRLLQRTIEKMTKHYLDKHQEPWVVTDTVGLSMMVYPQVLLMAHKNYIIMIHMVILVGARGFEPPTT